MAMEPEYISTPYRKVWKCACGHCFYNKIDYHERLRARFGENFDYDCCPYCGKDTDNWVSVSVKFLYHKIRKWWWPFGIKTIFYVKFAHENVYYHFCEEFNGFSFYEA